VSITYSNFQSCLRIYRFSFPLESKKENKNKKFFKVKKEDPAKSNAEIEPHLDPKVLLAALKVAGEKSRLANICKFN